MTIKLDIKNQLIEIEQGITMGKLSELNKLMNNTYLKEWQVVSDIDEFLKNLVCTEADCEIKPPDEPHWNGIKLQTLPTDFRGFVKADK